MRAHPTTVPAALLALLLTAPTGCTNGRTVAESADGDRLNRDIVSPVPEALEDCEALRDALRARDDRGLLDARDRFELRKAGCGGGGV